MVSLASNDQRSQACKMIFSKVLLQGETDHCHPVTCTQVQSVDPSGYYLESVLVGCRESHCPRQLAPLQLGLQVVVSYLDMGARNQTLVLCKSIKCSQPLSYLSCLPFCILNEFLIIPLCVQKDDVLISDSYIISQGTSWNLICCSKLISAIIYLKKICAKCLKGKD